MYVKKFSRVGSCLLFNLLHWIMFLWVLNFNTSALLNVFDVSDLNTKLIFKL